MEQHLSPHEYVPLRQDDVLSGSESCTDAGVSARPFFQYFPNTGEKNIASGCFAVNHYIYERTAARNGASIRMIYVNAGKLIEDGVRFSA